MANNIILFEEINLSEEALNPEAKIGPGILCGGVCGGAGCAGGGAGLACGMGGIGAGCGGACGGLGCGGLC